MGNDTSAKVGKPFFILSLDGGGTWALIQVKALLRLYGDISGHEVLQHFDLVAATSAGSIVVAGLVENMRLSALLDAFQSQSWREKIFVDLPWYNKFPRILGLGPRFSTKKKLAGLLEVFPMSAATLMPDIPARVIRSVGKSPKFLITSFDFDRERVAFFRSQTNSFAASFSPFPKNATLVDAVHASTNAPINFFDVPAQFEGSRGRYWDGGVSGNNNPVLAAVTEALANQISPRDVRALSIGTGNIFLPMANPKTDVPNTDPVLVKVPEAQGLVHDIKEVATTILDDPPDAASFISHVSLGGRLPQKVDEIIDDGPVVRMNPLVQPVLKTSDASGLLEWVFPGQETSPPNPNGLEKSDFTRLTELDIAVTDSVDVDVIIRFCDKWLGDIVPNQPIRARSDTLAVEIGHGRFSAAQAVWSKMERV